MLYGHWPASLAALDAKAVQLRLTGEDTVKTVAALCTLALAIGFTSLATAASADSRVAAPATSLAHEAWLRYRDSLQQQREELLKDPFAKDPIVRAQGLYLLQSMEAVAFNMYVAPRQQYPALYVQSIYMPYELSWGYPNPDFLYHDGFIDGAHTYRIYGNKRRSYWSTLQILRGFWGDEVQGDLAFVDFDDMSTKPNGDFEIFLGPNPPVQSDGKYWVKLDPKLHNIFLLLREVFYDWNRDEPMDIHIETLDRDPGVSINFNESELAARIEKARKFTEMNVKNIKFVLGLLKTGPNAGNETMIRNRFVNPARAATSQWAGNPIACYGEMLYDIQPDEALILEMPVVRARFWGIQLGSVWTQSADGFYHRGSINGAQARLDADGRLRAVVALQDPGVANWLDPDGVRIGITILRWYKAEGCPMPTVTKVKLVDVRHHLPKDTPVVTAEQRRAELDARRVASLRRYGQ